MGRKNTSSKESSRRPNPSLRNSSRVAGTYPSLNRETRNFVRAESRKVGLAIIRVPCEQIGNAELQNRVVDLSGACCYPARPEAEAIMQSGIVDFQFKKSEFPSFLTGSCFEAVRRTCVFLTLFRLLRADSSDCGIHRWRNQKAQKRCSVSMT